MKIKKMNKYFNIKILSVLFSAFVLTSCMTREKYERPKEVINENLFRTDLLPKDSVSMATVSTMAEADYLGIVSGNRVPDKVARAGLHAVKSEFVDAPVLSEFPLTLECKVSKVTKVGEDYHFVGDIVNILVDEDILTDGKIDVKKLQAITFDPAGGKYIALGDAVGNAYREGRKYMA